MKTHLLILCLLPAFCMAQEKVDTKRYEDLLSQKKYKQVFIECDSLRKKPYGKTSPVICYYLGRSLCGNGNTNRGKEWYQYIKDKMQIDKDFSKVLTAADASCTPNTNTATTTVINVVINASYTPNQPGGIRGKSGFALGCNKDADENYENLKKNDSLTNRIFAPNEKALAVAKLRTFLSDKYAIDTSGRFIVVSLANASYYHSDIVTVTDKLETAYKFYINKYHLQVPDKLFTVYLLPNRYELASAAKAVHDIRLSEANIGYSSLNDLSLLGISRPNAVGTLFHELFHLVIRSDVGDISPWLDEGMACLYSVYSMNGSELTGSYDTWRVMHFKLLMNLKPDERVAVPGLQQLLNLNWQEYQGGTEGNLCRASVNYALSNFFTLYLQYKNMLPTVVDIFKNKRNYAEDSLSPGPADTKLIEIAFHQSIDSVATGFYKWLKMEYSIDMNALMKQKPAYYRADIPDEFQSAYDSSNTFIAAIATESKLSAVEIKKLKDKQLTLFNSVAALSKNYIYFQKNRLLELAETDMAARESKASYEVQMEQEVTDKHNEVTLFINKLQSLAN